jgi:Flp pilus assembly protein TadB
VVAVAAAVAVVSVGAPGVIAGVTAVAGLLVRRRRHRDRSRVSRGDLAVSLDVLGGCLAVGAGIPAALAAAGVAAPAAVAATLATASLELSRGENPTAVWSAVESRAPQLAAVARLCARAAVTGAPTAEELHRLAAAMRADADVSRRQRLQRASVWLVLPLGLCFLPAFVLAGVVPLVVGTLPGLAR